MKFTASILLIVLASAQAQLGYRCPTSTRTLKIAGSSTVFPISEGADEQFRGDCPNVSTEVEGGGSSDGARRVCAQIKDNLQPVDIGDMSRDWKASEVNRAADGFTLSCLIGDTTRKVAQFEVAIDGITVAASLESTAEACIPLLPGGGLTTDQLRWMYTSYTEDQLSADGFDLDAVRPNSDENPETKLWSELITPENDPEGKCKATQILIAGAGDNSGTYEYFFEVTLPKFSSDEKPPADEIFFNSEVDEEIVAYLEEKEDAIGFFGFSYFVENADKLGDFAIKNSDGNYVKPSIATLAGGTYNPYGRFIYMNLWIDDEALAVSGPFLRLVLGILGSAIINGVGYVVLPDADLAKLNARLDSIFATTPPTNPPVTAAPTTAPTAAPTGGLCFSGHDEVEVQGVGAIRMENLKIGDAVLAADNTYSKVYSFGHYSPDVEATFVQINGALEMTGNHLIHANGKIVPAEQVKVGDVLSNDVVVKSVKNVTGKGLYAPFTESGKIAVNGVLASSYVSQASLKDVSYELQEMIQHVAIAPYRVYCTVMGCANESYNEFGYTMPVAMWLAVAAFFERNHWILANLPTLLVAVFGYYAYAKMNKTVVAEKPLKA